jgi:hypothetical protein
LFAPCPKIPTVLANHRLPSLVHGDTSTKAQRGGIRWQNVERFPLLLVNRQIFLEALPVISAGTNSRGSMFRNLTRPLNVEIKRSSMPYFPKEAKLTPRPSQRVIWRSKSTSTNHPARERERRMPLMQRSSAP